MCTVPLPPGDNPIVVTNIYQYTYMYVYIYIYINIRLSDGD